SLSSVNVHRRPLTVAVIVTQLVTRPPQSTPTRVVCTTATAGSPGGAFTAIDIWNDHQVGNGGAEEGDKTAVDGESPPSPGLRWAAAFLGLAVLAVGGVATFRSTNGAGSAALVVGGIALLVLAGLAERIDLLKVGNVEFHLRAAARQLSRRADELELQGDTAAAEQLRQEAEHLLLQASPAARRYE